MPLTIYESELEELYTKNLKERFGKYYRIYNQFKIPGYGIPDIVAFNSDHIAKVIHVDIYELKTEEFKISHLVQLIRYIKGFERWSKYKSYDYTIEGILVCKKPKSFGDSIYIVDYLSNVNVECFEFSLNGFEFENESGYFLTRPEKEFSKCQNQ